MVNNERINVTLTGGAPWGFRLAGGGALPLTINKIRKKSQAHVKGLVQGDAVISINGEPVHDKSQDEALELVDKAGIFLKLDIFRGNIDELSRDTPKKPIQIGGGSKGGEGSLTLTATVDDVSTSTAPPPVHEEAPSDFILTASVGDVSSDAFATSQPHIDYSQGFSATIGDVSGSEFTSMQESAPSGFTLSATVDDVTSSSNMVDSITAELGDMSSSSMVASSVVENVQSSTALSPNFAQPFTDSKSPNRLSPHPPRTSASPKAAFSPVAFSPKPTDPSPQPLAFSPKPSDPSPQPLAFSPKPNGPSPKLQPFSPKPNGPSPKLQAFSPKPNGPSPQLQPFSPKPIGLSPQPLAFSPRPNSLSPQPPAVSPKPASPQPFKSVSPRSPAAVPPPVSPKPSPVSFTSTTATFDDGQTHREVTREQHVHEKENGYGVTMVQRETTTSTSTNTKRTPFVKSQASAFNNVPPQTTSTSNATRSGMTSTVVKPVETNRGPAPFSNYAAPPPPPTTLQQNQMSTSSNVPRRSNDPSPVFRPTKFVPGQSKKEIPGLYSPTSPQIEVNVHAMYRDGKENMQPPQPRFQVKNIVTDKSKTRGREKWKPNIWMPDQQPTERQRPASVSADDFSPYSSFPVPVVQPGQSLVEKAKRSLKNSQKSRKPSEDYYYEYEEEPGYNQDAGKLHIFAPPVEISNMADSGYQETPYSAYLPYSHEGEIMYDYEDGYSSPESTLRKKRLYADSAFYDTPGKAYPTIGEQIKLCKIIAHSLTSQANRRARGAKMFMKRKRKSTKWIHEGHSEWSSSAGDVANIHDLDSELSPDEGGSKPLFYFKIPNLKSRIGSTDKKMALTQEQFEKMRLQAAKCDHKAVSPNACFDLVADLKASKGRGGRMFEKRRSKAEKYVIDENNARRSTPKAKLEHVLKQPVRQETSPWNAAIQHGGNVDAAFNHLSEMERNQKLNQILQYSTPRKQPTTPLMTPTEPHLFHTSLKSDNTAFLLGGKTFNRSAKGWSGGGEYPVAERLLHVQPPAKSSGASQAPLSPHFGDYNPRIRAWQHPGESPYEQNPSATQQATQQSRRPDQHESRRQEMAWQSSPRGHQNLNQQVRVDTYQNRPTSWQSDNYDATSYRDEYDYSYVPVDYKFNHSDYPNVAYMQPIIPGTDL